MDEDDLRDGMPIPSKVVVTSHLEKFANYFLEISLQGKYLTCLSNFNILK